MMQTRRALPAMLTFLLCAGAAATASAQTIQRFMVPGIICVLLMESLVILAWIIAYGLVGKVGS